jgi:hypothetical protein
MENKLTSTLAPRSATGGTTAPLANWQGLNMMLYALFTAARIGNKKGLPFFNRQPLTASRLLNDYSERGRSSDV